MTNEHKDLAAALSELRSAFDAHVARDAHLVADWVLHGYALDVIDQAEAVLALQASQTPRSAYPNSRAVFEAAEDALLLVTSPRYDDDGALAYAIEVVETHELRSRFLGADAAFNISDPPPDSMSPEQICTEDSKVADQVGANGDVLRAAFAEALKPRRAKLHWSGLSRKQILDELGRRLPTIEGLASAGDAFYGYASVQSHPRLRAWAQSRDRDDDGRLNVERREVDTTFPAGLAFVAVRLATLALGILAGRVKISEASV